MLTVQASGNPEALQQARRQLRRARANWHRAKLRAEGGVRARRIPARAATALRNPDGELEYDRTKWPGLL
eukprot:9540001-Lingulodinium_polyedra.AAC.1